MGRRRLAARVVAEAARSGGVQAPVLHGQPQTRRGAMHARMLLFSRSAGKTTACALAHVIQCTVGKKTAPLRRMKTHWSRSRKWM